MGDPGRSLRAERSQLGLRCSLRAPLSSAYPPTGNRTLSTIQFDRVERPAEIRLPVTGRHSEDPRRRRTNSIGQCLQLWGEGDVWRNGMDEVQVPVGD